MHPTTPGEDDVYRRLQRHLDRMPVPYPATESGVELRILRRLFTPDEAVLVLCLSMIPERLTVISRRVARETRSAEGDPAVARASLASTLDSMAARGLIQRLNTRRGGLYGKSVFIVGFYEAQVNRLSPELQRDVDQYLDEAFGPALLACTPQMRTVPINAAIPVERVVGRYDDIREFVRASPGPFAVMNCICQQGRDLLGEPCRQTDNREHCLTIGTAAKAMVRRGAGRFVTRDETLAFLDRADRDGLVVQPQNTQDPLFICCCCGCCCGVLTTAKKLPRPAEFFATNYRAVSDPKICHGCGLCATRCQMDAIDFPDGEAAVRAERCIGCGLCVTTCPSDAMRLVRKDEGKEPPQDTGRLYARMYRERFGTLRFAAAAGRRLIGLQS